jgi:hypothetical protein
MKPNLPRIRDSKRAFQRQLAARPIVEKLRMLDALRERTLAIRGATPAGSTIIKEKPAHYRAKKAARWSVIGDH